MNVNWKRMSLTLLFATLAVALFVDVAAAQDTEAADNDNTVLASGKLAAGIALAGCAIGTGLSQGQIGAAGVGMVAEDSSKFVTALIFMAIPETIVLFGFVSLFIL